MRDQLVEHCMLFDALESLAPVVRDAADVMAKCLAAGGKIMFCGNGGSAADSKHFAAELVGRFVDDRAPLAGLALSTDSSALTCIGNDYGFEHVFERQVIALGRSNDVLVGISTSGNSLNVVLALRAARERGMQTIGLLGADGGNCAAWCDVSLIVPSRTTARIQEAHIFLVHILCGEVENTLKVTG